MDLKKEKWNKTKKDNVLAAKCHHTTYLFYLLICSLFTVNKFFKLNLNYKIKENN